METQQLNIRRGSVLDHIDDLENLFSAHWDELILMKSLMALSLDRSSYISLEEAGKLVTLYVYCGERVVGYSCNILNNHLHHNDLLVAYNDALFLHKDFRKGSLGIRLMSETEKEVKKEGAGLILWFAKEETSLHKLLTHMKYNIQEITFSKEL